MRRLIAFLTAILMILFFLPQLEAKTGWPLKIPVSFSSSFGEFRGMRFHAGVDFRTQQKNGIPVYAIADGYISRIGVSYRNYGYVLYLTHPELGIKSVYAHLQEFSEPMKSHVEAKLKKMKARHGLSEFFGPDSFPVKKGQQIALSGESGSGPPHLHFELRNMKDEPVAPALYGYRETDKIWPKMSKIYLVPLSYGSVIDGSFMPASFWLSMKTKESYSLDYAPSLLGKVGIQAGIYDYNNFGGVFGVEDLELKINGKTSFKSQFHRYPYNKDYQCPMVYDYFNSQNRKLGYAYMLYKLPWETLPFSDGWAGWSGVFDEKAFSGDSSRASFEVTAHDFGRNAVKLNGKFRHYKGTFNAHITDAELDAYSFGELFHNFYSLISVGRVGKKVKQQTIRTGHVVCKDSKGRESQIPCILFTNKAELAFPVEESWADGAWLLNGKMVLSPSEYIPENGKTVSFENGLAELKFNRNTLEFPIFASMKSDKASMPSYSQEGFGTLKAFSPVWDFFPGNIVFSRDVKVSVKADSYAGDRKKLSLYSFDDKGNVICAGGSFEGDFLTLGTRTGGRYVIMEDLVPPEIKYHRYFKHYQLGHCYSFKVTDFGSGADLLSAEAFSGNKKLDVYSDPDKNEVYIMRPSLKKPFEMTLTVKDNAGNIATATKSVTQ
ncbi:MAG: M23 family metallopeptidase [Candidatus Riflebacteria bacterium]|nr:M23 family metallopeptidase [Candidatus Riflebacteria bacterium]